MVYSREQLNKIASMACGKTTFIAGDEPVAVVKSNGDDFIAAFVPSGDQGWVLDRMSDAGIRFLSFLEEDYPCAQHATSMIHDLFWSEGMTFDQAYLAAKQHGVPEQWLDAFLVGKLNYQVGNGGLGQWVDNGYARMLQETKQALARIGGNAAKKTERILLDIEPHLSMTHHFEETWEEGTFFRCTRCNGSGVVTDEDDNGEETACSQCDGTGEEEEEGEYYEKGRTLALLLDEAYYSVKDSLMEATERHAENIPAIKGFSFVDRQERLSMLAGAGQ